MKKKSHHSVDIDHIAKLANLPLTSSEKSTFEKQLKDILTYVNKLSEVETNNVEPIGHVTGLVNIARKDEPAPSLSQEQALKNAPKAKKGLFEVDAIFEEQ